jgi:MFS family permease
MTVKTGAAAPGAGEIVSPSGTRLSQVTADNFAPSGYAWYVVGLISLSATFAYIDRIVVSLVTPAIQADLGLRDSQLGLLQGLAFAIFYTLFGIPLGIVADRWSRKKLLTIGISIWSFMTALCGAASSFGTLFLARLGVGMGEASLNPCVTSLVSDYFPPDRRPRAIAVYIVGQGVGHGLAYIFGGALLGWLAARGGLNVPGLGHTKPWQSIFLLVGIAGLLPAALFALTVREPARRELSHQLSRDDARSKTRRFIVDNRRTLICHHFGLALTIMIAYGFGNWIPTFFLRVYHWPTQRFSVIYGSVNIGLGIFTPLVAGWLASWLRQRGVIDASWRIALTGSCGCTLFGALAPLMPTPETSLVAYFIAGIFVALPSMFAYITIAEFVPNELRGFITGMYFLVNGVISVGLGPFAVGLATDYLFKNNTAIGHSLSLVSVLTGLPGVLLLVIGLKPFRESLSRATWAVHPSRGVPSSH